MRTLLCFLLSALSCSAQLFGNMNVPWMASQTHTASSGPPSDYIFTFAGALYGGTNTGDTPSCPANYWGNATVDLWLNISNTGVAGGPDGVYSQTAVMFSQSVTNAVRIANSEVTPGSLDIAWSDNNVVTEIKSSTSLLANNTMVNVIIIVSNGAPIQFWKNGVLLSGNQAGDGDSLVTGTCVVGARVPAVNGYWGGVVTNATIFARDLSASEITNLFNAGVHFPSGL